MGPGPTQGTANSGIEEAPWGYKIQRSVDCCNDIFQGDK